jgi:hypothetical protein
VEASDGYLGRVHDLLADPSTGHVTHIILERGHLWGKREIAIPVSLVHEITDEAVYLEIDEQAAEKLPVVPTRHRYAWVDRADVELLTLVTQRADAADAALKALESLAEEGGAVLNAVAVVVDGASPLLHRRGALAKTEYDALFADVVRGLTGLSAGAHGAARNPHDIDIAHAPVSQGQEERSEQTMIIALVGEPSVEAAYAAIESLGTDLTREPLTDEFVSQLVVAGNAE